MSMDLERREFVAAGATALGGALAGCSGDDEDENGNEEETPTEADNEQPDEPLGIDHVRFAAEEPTDYREYEAVENAPIPPTRSSGSTTSRSSSRPRTPATARRASTSTSN
ncbi:hypothetical protein BRD19_11865 [Halobacteriales archaeon SW_7_65_23]|nr:MAG: hypothetical protein BRD19_11865 [Halobacteriales archaeon SW_7_65_23]